MAPKSKTKKSVARDTPKTRGKQTARRTQPPHEFPSNHTGESSSDESEPSLTAVMNQLVDMNVRLTTNEQLLDDLMAEKMTEEESRLQTPFLTCANPGTSSHHQERGDD